MTRCYAATLAFLAWTISVTAEEPLWTDQDRREKSDVVCLGTVISADKAGPIDDNNDLYLAIVEITGMKKGGKTSRGTRINVYYEFSSSGQNTRCPTYAELAKGDKGIFYLRNITDEIKKALKIETVKEPALFLEMGSDVKKETTEPSVGGDVKPASHPMTTSPDPSTTVCPQCGSNLTQVPYLVSGVPTKEMAEKMERGEVLLAGCLGTNKVATVCLKCRKWKTYGMKFWQPLPKQFGNKPSPAGDGTTPAAPVK